MGDDTTYQAGAVDLPPPSRIRKLEVAGGDGDIPESFIVSGFRHWFDDKFNPIFEKVHTAEDGSEFDQDQHGLDDCVGMGARLVKTGHEGKAISARDTWNLAKRLDAKWGYPLTGYGATLWAGIEALDVGPATEELVPTDVMPRDEFLDMESYLTEEIRRSRIVHSGAGRPFFTDRNGMVKAIHSTDSACITSLQWFTGDNLILTTIGSPEGDAIGGHCVACIGQILGEPIMVTYSKGFAWSGMFLVPPEQLARFGNAYFHVDEKTADFSELLYRYDGKDLMLVGTNQHWRCELGVMRQYPDDITWWAFGKLFGYDTQEIHDADFIRIPRGKDMDIKDAPFKMKERVRQIRQFDGKL